MTFLDGLQSTLAPGGPEGALLAETAWMLFVGAALVFLAVMALLAWSIPGRRAFRERAFIVGGGIVFPGVTLVMVLAYTLARGQEVQAPADETVRIEVTGEQWWWRVRYLDADGRIEFETANEIRIPVGRSIRLDLKSADVIHSFWVPSLAGKLDMIPGRTQRLQLNASRAGEFRGQCAEYCGGPHGLMAFFVVAQDDREFATWASGQRAPSTRVNALFLRYCAACHTVRGTPASGTRGPDLTHVASRRTIGAALLPMSEGIVARWITSSQHFKPGNLMPSFPFLHGKELSELAAYVESLR